MKMVKLFSLEELKELVFQIKTRITELMTTEKIKKYLQQQEQ